MKKQKYKMIIGIIGGHFHNTNKQALSIAEKTGEILAKRNLAVACGGEDGIMEAVCKGCKKAGGTTIAIMKGNKKSLANKYIDYVIPTSLDLAFMNVLVWASDGLIAFDGKYGTMSELGLALDIGRPIVALGEHQLINKKDIDSPDFAYYDHYDQKKLTQAIDHLLKMIKNYDNKHEK
ncbi:MAG: hypothetical protein ABIJ23_00135, partial [Candidatus Magasanikbacteria bacterium]